MGTKAMVILCYINKFHLRFLINLSIIPKSRPYIQKYTNLKNI